MAGINLINVVVRITQHSHLSKNAQVTCPRKLFKEELEDLPHSGGHQGGAKGGASPPNNIY